MYLRIYFVCSIGTIKRPEFNVNGVHSVNKIAPKRMSLIFSVYTVKAFKELLGK